ncbi:hypothetical protein CAC42_1688 [Sphaceloma murrayae]|uniref:Rhodopsin domain-containing protein n=1 Tax=Sphaceloma murrayae TaxID=2082308 RepID=A0A2K1QHM3_9PEZI|nr:hypothetical protein CAC42_1688 [Sphaceloma murrayae]
MGWVKNGAPELDDASNWRTIVAVNIVCTLCMAIVLSLRIGVRAFVVKATGADDWFLWLAAVRVFILGLHTQTDANLAGMCHNQLYIEHHADTAGSRTPRTSATNRESRRVHNGKKYLSPLQQQQTLTCNQHNFVNRTMYVIASTCYKISLCASYMRIIAKSGHRHYRFVVWATMALSAGYGTSFLFAIVFACNPVEKSWKPKVPGKCFPPSPFYYGTTVTNILIDIIVLFLPIPLLWRLQMNKRRKMGLILCFALGALTTVGASMRLASVAKVVRFGDPDEFVMWSSVEINLGIITGSIPALLPLLKKVRGTTTSSGPTGPQSHSVRSGRAQLRNMTIGSARRSTKNGTLTETYDDSDKSSQENILGITDRDIEHGAIEISKTVDMHVSTSSAPCSNSARQTYELDRIVPFEPSSPHGKRSWEGRGS